MKHQIYCLDLKLGMGEMIWKIENDWYFGQETKRKKNLMKFQIKWDIIRHAYAKAHILLSQKHGVLKPPTMSEVFNRMQAQSIRESWKSTVDLQIPRYRLGEQREAWPLKESSWEEEGTGNRQERPLCPKAKYWCFLEKEQKSWAVTGGAGRKGRKRGRVWRQNRNGEGEVTLITTLLFGNV